jgi:hypothetical protein
MRSTTLSRWPHLAGMVIQGLILGIGVALAITQLVAVVGQARVFRYQGF